MYKVTGSTDFQMASELFTQVCISLEMTCEPNLVSTVDLTFLLSLLVKSSGKKILLKEEESIQHDVNVQGCN